MKKILKLAAIACAAVMFVSCGAKDDKSLVKETLEKYKEAMFSFDYSSLKSLVTEANLPSLEYYKQQADVINALPAEAKKAAVEAAKTTLGFEFDAESITVNENDATATATFMGQSLPIALKKVDGKWLIDGIGNTNNTVIDEVEVEEIDGGDIEEPISEEEETDAPTENAEDGAAE